MFPLNHNFAQQGATADRRFAAPAELVVVLNNDTIFYT